MKKIIDSIKKMMDNGRSFCSKLSFDGVLFLNFIKIFLIYTISMSSVSVFVFVNSINNINNDIHQQIEKDGEKIAYTLMNQYNNAKSIAASMAIDANVRNFINNAMPEMVVGNNERVLGDKILMYKNISKCIDSITLYSNKNKQFLYYDKVIALDEFEDGECIEPYINNKNDTFQVILRKSEFENKNFITFISGLNSLGIDGAVVVNIDIAKLRNNLGDFMNEDSDFYILSDSEIVFCKNSELLFTQNESDVIKNAVTEKTTLKGEGKYVAYVESHFGNNWECVYTVSTHSFRNVFWNNNSGTVLLLISSLLIGVILSFILSINISKPITNLFDIINKYSKNGKLEDEIINVQQLGTKIISVMESNAELKREIDDRLSEYRKLQMIALQTQINPHFIHNTLNIISMSAIIQTDNGEQVSKLLNEASKLIRYTYDSEKTVTVRQEVQFLKRYIELMQLCYPNIEFVMEIDDGILEYKVVRICIQPLIENAIYHGMAGDKSGQICLRMSGNNDKMTITVEDNGRGMEEGQKKKILDSINNEGEFEKNIGLGNIYRRLKLFFGDEIEFRISSEYDSGTTVEITLPRI